MAFLLDVKALNVLSNLAFCHMKIGLKSKCYRYSQFQPNTLGGHLHSGYIHLAAQSKLHESQAQGITLRDLHMQIYKARQHLKTIQRQLTECLAQCHGTGGGSWRW